MGIRELKKKFRPIDMCDIFVNNYIRNYMPEDLRRCKQMNRINHSLPIIPFPPFLIVWFTTPRNNKKKKIFFLCHDMPLFMRAKAKECE